MKKIVLWCLLCVVGVPLFSQSLKNNTLLWRISGKGITQPSYLFGTIHLLCADDIQISDSLKAAISKSDEVYLEVDMDNLFEMMGVMTKMNMRNDTTLADLLTEEQYQKVKAFFKGQKSMLPFSMLEKFKPMLSASTLMQSSLDCDNSVAMEQLIMKEAKSADKRVKGLETMAYQMSIFDSIPYKVQAGQLLKYVEDFGKGSDTKDFEELTKAYRNQELDKLENLINKEGGDIENFSQVLLYNRNADWVKKLEELLADNSLVIAVGAGHLPGSKGIINLLRKAGYKVEPVENKMIKKKEKEI